MAELWTPERVAALPGDLRARLLAVAAVPLSRYIPHIPHPKQAAFLMLPHREAFFGGAGGGGKSESLLMGAFQWCDVPGYSALLLRRSYQDLSLPGALLDRARSWLAGTGARWDGHQTFHFPSGAKVAFGYIGHDYDHLRYKSAEFQYIGFDELTEFKEDQYKFLFTRLRRLQGVSIQLKMRSASNPGGAGHDWVKARFVSPGAPRRPYVPARIADNPSLDRDEYRRSLSHVDPITRAQIEHGDWEVRQAGRRFRREWFDFAEPPPARCRLQLRYWDLAASEPSERASDPDWTVGTLLGWEPPDWYVLDVARFRAAPGKRDQAIRAVALRDGPGVPVRVEQEPGSGGKSQVATLASLTLPEFAVAGDRPTGNLLVRAAPAASKAELGHVRLVRSTWNEAWLDELEGFPDLGHDDQVASFAGAFNCLAALAGRATWGIYDRREA